MSKQQSLVGLKESKTLTPYSGPPFKFNLELKKFEDDFNTIYKKITDVFPRFEPKKKSSSVVSVYRYLVNQLIWTFKYLVEMAALENDEKWLRGNFPIFNARFLKIMPHIIALNPDLWNSIKYTLDKTEKLQKGESYGSFAWRWTENILDLGPGVIVRDVLKDRRIREAKQRLETCYEEISTHNDAAIINVENYEKHIRDKTFRRESRSVIAVHNRQKRLVFIAKQLEKDPKDECLQLRQRQLLEQEAKYQETETIIKKELDEKEYSELVKKRGYKIEKINAKISLEAFTKKYKKVAVILRMDDTDSHANLIFRIDLLGKMLSKTCGNDRIHLDYRHFMTLLSKVRKEIDNLNSIRTLLPTSEVIVMEGKVSPIPVPFTPSDFRLIKKFSEADFRKISVIKQMRQHYFQVQRLLIESGFPENAAIIAENDCSYEKLINDAAKFFLSLPRQEQKAELFEIDEKTKLTVSYVTKKYHQLGLIFSTDKMDSLDSQRLMSCIIELRQELNERLNEENFVKISGSMEQCINRIAKNLLFIHGWFESLLGVNSQQFKYYVARNIYRFNAHSREESSKRAASALTPVLTLK